MTMGGEVMQRALRLFSVLIIVLPCLFAEFGSDIQGTIVDKSGGAIPNAQVEVTNLATGINLDVLTSDAGIFRVLSVGIGAYSVTVKKEVFLPAEQPSLELAANEVRKDLTSNNFGKVTIAQLLRLYAVSLRLRF
jgi:hypothetical protein